MANISKKIREVRLSWFAHVERKTEEYVVMRKGIKKGEGQALDLPPSFPLFYELSSIWPYPG